MKLLDTLISKVGNYASAAHPGHAEEGFAMVALVSLLAVITLVAVV